MEGPKKLPEINRFVIDPAIEKHRIKYCKLFMIILNKYSTKHKNMGNKTTIQPVILF